jgi:hypothetical protein
MSVWKYRTVVTSVLALLLILSCANQTTAQSASQSRPSPTPRPVDPTTGEKSEDPGPLTTFEEEMRAKRAIKIAEKEYEDNVKRAKELSDLAKDLRQSSKSKSTLDRDDSKKLDRLEKLTKKIRGEAGGEDEEVKIEDRPGDTKTALTQIVDTAESLAKSVQNTPRQVVSASVIGNANVLLELIRIVRTFGAPR